MDRKQYVEFERMRAEIETLKSDIAKLKFEVQHMQVYKADRRGPKRGN